MGFVSPASTPDVYSFFMMYFRNYSTIGIELMEPN
jgi:hypothetical protein